MCSTCPRRLAAHQSRAGRRRLVIAIDGKTVRGAKSKGGKAPHLVAALAHSIGAVLGQVAVDEKSNEIPAVRELLKAFADVAVAVFTIDAMHTQTDTAQVILARRADYVLTVNTNNNFLLLHFAELKILIRRQLWGSSYELIDTIEKQLQRWNAAGLLLKYRETIAGKLGGATGRW